MFKKVCIIGCGLIGSSIARAIRKQNLSAKIVSSNRSDSVNKKVIELKIVDDSNSDTKKMVDEIKLKGIKVISYYIEESSYSNRYAETFKEMYGNDSQFINVTSVMAVAKSMNKKFLEKN